jgi:myosin heavy subunit
MATSKSNGLVKAIFADAEKHKGSKVKSAHESLTVSSKFLSQLSILKGILDAADTRFVRCIKTNDSAAPQEVHFLDVAMRQLCLYFFSLVYRTAPPLLHLAFPSS